MSNYKQIASILLLFLCFFNQAWTQVPVPTINLNTFKWGLKDSATNAVILEAKLDYIMEFHNGIAITRMNNLYGFINEEGKTIAQPIYKRCFWVNDSLLLVQNEDLFGLINAAGQTAIPCVFSALDVYDQYIVVNNGEHCGIIDLSGNIIIPFQYEEILPERNPLGGMHLDKTRIRVRSSDGIGIIDYTNKTIVPTRFETVRLWPENFILIWEDGKTALLNSLGAIIIPPGKYALLEPLSGGYIVAEKEGLFGFISAKKEELIPFNYQDAHAFQNDFATVKKDSLWGLINKKNEVVLPFEYSRPIFFYNGIARVDKRINGISKCAFITTELKQLTPFEFDEGTQFENEYAQVRIGTNWGIINKNGVKIVPVNYEKIAVRYGYVVVSTAEKYGLYDLDGTMILPNTYSFVYPTRDDPFIMVRIGRLYGYVNHKGKIVLPVSYENARNFAYGRATVLEDGESFEIDREGKRIGL